jgi:4-amino-4-deoxy-L-arabinose transferase-like glycosyltransferase
MNQDDLSPEFLARAARERQDHRRREQWTFIAMGLVVLIGAIARWWFLQTVNTQPVTDFHWYYQRAVEISQGQGYRVDGHPTAYWPVGWPGFLGLMFKLFGASVWTGKGLNFCLSLSAVPLTFLLGLALFRSRVTAVLAAFLVAVHPGFIAYSGILASEPLFTFLTLIGTLWLVKGQDRPTRWVLGGIAFGLACLVRPQAAVLPALILACVWIWDSPFKREYPFWRSFGLTHAAMALVLTLWIVRCSVLMGGVFFVSTNGGDNLVIGAHDGASGRYVNPDKLRPTGGTELERDKTARELGKDWIVHHKRAWLALAKPKLEEAFLAGRDVAYWGFQKDFGRLTAPGEGADKGLYLGMRDYSVAFSRWLLYLSIFGLAACVLAQKSRREKPALPISTLAIIGASALVVVVFFGNSRFVLPIVPLMALWAAHGPVCLAWFFSSLAPPAVRAEEAPVDETPALD